MRRSLAVKTAAATMKLKDWGLGLPLLTKTFAVSSQRLERLGRVSMSRKKSRTAVSASPAAGQE